MKTPRKLNDVEMAILRDFNRKPVRSKGEIADRDGRVLIHNIDHYYQRPLGVLMSRKHIDFFKRCGCDHPCLCECNGWHITESGVAELAGKAA